MPNSRQNPNATVLVRTFGVTFGLGRRDVQRFSPPPSAGWDQLIYAARGIMTVYANDCAWAVPPHRAVWIPADRRCQVEMHGEVALRILYLRLGLRLRMSVVNVTPLMRELIERAVVTGALDGARPAQKRIAGVIRDEIGALSAMPLQLPMPKDTRAVRFADLVLRSNDLQGMLRQCGASRRTMERLIREDTAMSLGQWLRRFQLTKSLRLLAAGASVKEAALAVGYANASAFIAMFRRELGETPAKYFEK
jgi:AraC-like DNA-binding protein